MLNQLPIMVFDIPCRRAILWVLTAFFLPICCPAQEQVVHFESYGHEKGFKNVLVWDVAQDSFGFIWIGTLSGLVRFNGYEFKEYNYSPKDTTSVSGAAVTKLYVDTKGILFIATAKGLNRFDRERDCIFRYPIIEDNNPDAVIVYAIHRDRKGRLWVGTQEGLYHFDKKRNKFVRKFHPDFEHTQTSDMPVRAILEDASGNIWAGGFRGLYRLDEQRNKLIREYLPSDKLDRGGLLHINALWCDKNRNVWVGTNEGVRIWDSKGKKLLLPPLPSPLCDFYTNTFLDDGNGNLWIGTAHNGLIRFSLRDSSYTHFQTGDIPEYSLVDNRIYGLFKDRDQNIWIATEGGLNRINLKAEKFPHYRLKPTQRSDDNIIFRIHEDKRGGIWIATNGGKIFRSAGLGKPMYEIPRPVEPIPRPSAPIVHYFFNYSDDLVWVSCSGGNTFYYDLDASKWIWPERRYLLQDHMITRLSDDPTDHNLIWMSTKIGTCRLDKRDFSIRTYPHRPFIPGLTNDAVNTMEHTPDGNLIVNAGEFHRGTLAYFDKKKETFTPLIFEKSDTSKPAILPVRNFSFAPNHIAWMSSPYGLFSYDLTRRVLRHWYQQDGLPNLDVSSVLCDKQGNVWLACEGYISKFDPVEETFQNFDVFDGVKDFHSWSNATGADGRFFFGGLEGFYAFYPDAVRLDSSLPVVVLTGFNVLNKSRHFGTSPELLKEITLDYVDKVFSFEFAALHFLQPSNNRYKYRLLGFDDDWVNVGTERRATYSNLWWGEYEFQVVACNADGIWNEQALSVRLMIKPPWWGTNWAIVLYGIIIFGSFYSFYQFRLNRRLAQAEARRLQELDAVKTKLYTNITHEFRTPLTVILGEASQLDKQVGTKQKGALAAIRWQGRHLLLLVNQMLDLAKVEAGSLHLDMIQGNVILFLKYLLESFHSLADSKQIELRFECDTEEFWMDYDPDKLQKIVSNLLSNAIKFTPSAGKVVLQVITSKGLSPLPTLKMTVSDTGAGLTPEELLRVFDRFYQADDSATRQAEGTGIGLTLTKELVQLLGGQISAESQPGEGSAFTVMVPVTHLATKQRFQPEIFFIENQQIKPEISEAPEFPASNFKRNRPRLLLVEDNPDVLRYISALLAADYQIYKSKNGAEGIDAAFRLVPDIIISDVMMPVMDGFELCRILKTDERTSHIPIILLTAKADHASKIEGLTQGADVYLPKPFDREELLVHLEKLVELRRHLQERYAKFSRFINPRLAGIDKSATLDVEERFLQKAVSIVEAQMGKEDFDMSQLCEMLHMSRSNLFRKLKDLTGKSATDFIRTLRLEKAKELLETSGLNVTEVCFKVGFNSPNHFSKVFHEYFGMTPSEVKKL